MLLFTAKGHTWLGGDGALDLGEICQLRCWKRSSFEFGHARQPLRIGMVRGKRTPLRLGAEHSIFAVIYCKRSHLAPGRWVARSRRDLPLSPLERLQLRVLATRISAVPPHFPRLSPWTRVVRSATGHASSTIEPVSHRDTTWEKHPLAPAFLVLSISKVDTWLVENRTIYQLEK